MTGDGDPGRAATERDAAVIVLRDLIQARESVRSAVASRFGIGVRESEAVSYLRVSGPMTRVELAAALHLTSGTVTNLLDRLERADLARREHHPTDGRPPGASSRPWPAPCGPVRRTWWRSRPQPPQGVLAAFVDA